MKTSKDLIPVLWASGYVVEEGRAEQPWVLGRQRGNNTTRSRHCKNFLFLTFSHSLLQVLGLGAAHGLLLLCTFYCQFWAPKRLWLTWLENPCSEWCVILLLKILDSRCIETCLASNTWVTWWTISFHASESWVFWSGWYSCEQCVSKQTIAKATA